MAKPSSQRSPPAAAPPNADSARAVLESLAADRGTRLLSEADFQEARRCVLNELAEGPRARPFTLFTFGVVGLIFLGFFLIGLSMWLHDEHKDWLLAVSSAGCLAFWAYVLRQYVAGLRQARLALTARLDELEELRRNDLITQAEFEQIYATILCSRVTT